MHDHVEQDGGRLRVFDPVGPGGHTILQELTKGLGQLTMAWSTVSPMIAMLPAGSMAQENLVQILKVAVSGEPG